MYVLAPCICSNLNRHAIMHNAHACINISRVHDIWLTSYTYAEIPTSRCHRWPDKTSSMLDPNWYLPSSRYTLLSHTQFMMSPFVDTCKSLGQLFLPKNYTQVGLEPYTCTFTITQVTFLTLIPPRGVRLGARTRILTIQFKFPTLQQQVIPCNQMQDF